MLIKGVNALSEKMKIVSSIPGIGNKTTVTIIAETNVFELLKNERQLMSYAGLDVKEKTSGKFVKSKPRISERGNRNSSEGNSCQPKEIIGIDIHIIEKVLAHLLLSKDFTSLILRYSLYLNE